MGRPGVRQVPEGSASGEQGKIENTGCKIICGAPTTLAVTELMMMMKLTDSVPHSDLQQGTAFTNQTRLSSCFYIYLVSSQLDTTSYTRLSSCNRHTVIPTSRFPPQG